MNTKSHNSGLYSALFHASLIGMLLILFALPYRISAVVSLGTGLIGGAAMLLFVLSFMKYFGNKNQKAMLLFFLFFFVFVSLVLGGSLSYGNFVSAICFLELPIFLVAAEQVASKKTAKTFLLSHYLLSWYYIFLSFSDRAYFYENEFGVTQLEEMTLGYRNPNEAAVYLLCSIIVLFVGVRFFKKRILSFFFGLNAFFLCYLLYLTQSRTGIVLSALMILLLIFSKKIKSGKVFCSIALTVPVIAVFLIMFFSKLLEELQLMGDSLDTGRKAIFERAFQDLGFSEFFFGDFSAFSFTNLHNFYISVFATAGILGAVLFAFFLRRALKDRWKQQKEVYQKLALCGTGVLIMQGSMEAALFVAGSAYAMGFVSVYILAAAEEGE